MPVFQWAIIMTGPNPGSGSEQRGLRPVLVISNEEFNQAMPNVTVLPLTTTSRRLYPSEILLPRGTAGQPYDSIIMAHQVRTISKQRLGDILGYLSDSRLQGEVRQAVKEHLDLD
jgi:mRNA interferase MazF